MIWDYIERSKNFYEILSVKPNASQDSIEDAYHSITRADSYVENE